MRKKSIHKPEHMELISIDEFMERIDGKNSEQDINDTFRDNGYTTTRE